MRKLLIVGLLLIVSMPAGLFAQNADAFVTIWNSANTGVSADHEIRFFGFGNGYTVHWQEVDNPSNSGSLTAGNILVDEYQLIDFGTPGKYKVWVDPTEGGTFYQYDQQGDEDKLLEIAQWGNTTWASFFGSFESCFNLDLTATDAPDLSNVTTMEYMFGGCHSLVANSAINTWNTSKVTNMTGVFSGAHNFNQSLSNWNTSNVTSMSAMFNFATVFNADISGWNTGAVTDFAYMFANTNAFNQPLGSWDTHSAKSIAHMFANATAFNQPIAGWSTAAVTDMEGAFINASMFNRALDSWNVSNVTSIAHMFDGAKQFNQPLNTWNTGNVTSMASVFKDAINFDQPINSWDLSKVTRMDGMFEGASSFDQPLDNWETNIVTDMSNVFKDAVAFNQDLNSWDLSQVTTTAEMFNGATKFNQSVDNWNTSNIVNMDDMFNNASHFNQPLGNWNMSSVANLNFFLENATAFNQDISNWNINGLGNAGSLSLDNFLDNCDMDCVNYSMFLNALAANTNLPKNVTMGAAGLIYSSIAHQAHEYLETTKGWTIAGDGFTTNCTVTVPVTLSVFNAVYKAPFTEITWTTGVADDLAYFEVQQSLDGITFKTIRKLSKQTGNSQYICKFQGPVGTAYYRLKISELTGKVGYSATKTVTASLSEPKTYLLYPNPVKGNTLHILSSKSTTSEVVIYNQLGQQIGLYQLLPGENSINVTKLASGVYWLRETVENTAKGVKAGAQLHEKDSNENVKQSRGQHLKFIIQH